MNMPCTMKGVTIVELVDHRELIRPFIICGHQCIVVPSSPHVIRIFYREHVYDVLLTHDELKNWQNSGTDWRREYIRNLLQNELINTPAKKRNSSIEDGYIA